MADKELRSEITGRGLIVPRQTVVLPTLAKPLGSGRHAVKLDLVRGENDGLQATHPETKEPLFADEEGKEPLPARSENLEVYCVYPDDYRKTHQVKTVGELLDRVAMVFRNHFSTV